MPEPRKATSSPPDLDLSQWATAQMKAGAIEADEGLRKRCADCPGPDAGGCDGPVRWQGKLYQTCPRGMLRSHWWQGVVELRAASLVSPLAGWPSRYASRVVEGCIELRSADMKNAEEKIEASRKGTPGAPQFSGRRSAKAVP